MSASPEALAALTDSADAWSAYCRAATKPIDLTLAQLSHADLQGRSFTFCDLSGADLESTNLDDCSFINTKLLDTMVNNASIVSTSFTAIDAKDALFDHAVIRNSHFADVNFSHAGFASSTISGSTFHKCSFKEARLDRLRIITSVLIDVEIIDVSAEEMDLKECELRGAKLYNIHLATSRIVDSDLSMSRISDSAFLGSIISETRFTGATIIRFSMTGSSVQGLDLTDSTLREVDLTDFDLPGSIMLGAAIVRCRWPRQSPVISWSGHYQKTPHLLGQPVQDLRGLSPTLRREIADAQYLDALSLKSRKQPRAAAFRAWGVTTAFGQSMLRLTAVTALLVVALGISLALVRNHTLSWSLDFDVLARSMLDISGAFLELASPVISRSSLSQDILLTIARISGFFILGLWISIAANKLAKLSSE